MKQGMFLIFFEKKYSRNKKYWKFKIVKKILSYQKGWKIIIWLRKCHRQGKGEIKVNEQEKKRTNEAQSLNTKREKTENGENDNKE